MPRQIRPWYRASRQGWYATVDGQQVPLEVTDPTDEAAAWVALEKLLKRAASHARSGVRAGTVAELVPQYLASREGEVELRTLRNYASYLARFAADYGTRQIDQIDGLSVPKRASTYGWSGTNTANYLGYVEMFLRWCGRTDLRFKKPHKASRGAETVIPDPVYQRCLRATSGDFHQILRFLWHTGCRPGEVARIAAESVDWANRLVRAREHKTRRHGKTRTIYLDETALDVLREQADRYGGGHLFRGQRGQAFSFQAYTTRFQRLREKVGHPVTSYAFRHTFATRLLSAGESAAIVAALLGHSSTQMLDRHYSHLADQAKVMQAALDRFGGKPAA